MTLLRLDRLRRRRPTLSLTGAMVALSVGVVLPVLLSTSVGIVTLVRGESSYAILVGVLVISFAAAALGGVAAAAILLGRRARIARLQADLLANVSHDLRTPLTSIRMYAQTLATGRLDEDPARRSESLETILRETEWLEEIIDRILTWRSAAKDRDTLEPVDESVEEAVRQAVARFERMVPADEARLSVALESTARVKHDRHAVASIVLNLLVNAYKYGKSPKEIRLSTRDEPGGARAAAGSGRRVIIAVEDNGIGIPREELRRIFEPFYRVEAHRRSAPSGAGLGLAVVRHFAEAQGGQVSVESKEGLGSRFSVTLPALGEELAK
ncbi:MAG: HAMP domain-containing histidine kinase [Deltaproteobacteria bacterium]|nr:HAMP domain-containing histidine kinase [Deltaproteobacteria bacterium]